MKRVPSALSEYVDLGQMLREGKVSRRQLATFRANPVGVRPPYKERQFLPQPEDLTHFRALSAEEACWVEPREGGVQLIGSVPIQAIGERIVPLEEVSYVGPQPFLVSDRKRGSCVCVVDDRRFAQRIDVSEKAGAVPATKGKAYVIDERPDGSCRFVAWNRETGSLWSRDFDQRPLVVGNLLVFRQGQYCQVIGDDQQWSAPGELFAFDWQFLEGVCVVGAAAVLVATKDRFGFAVMGRRPGFVWLPENTVNAYALHVSTSGDASCVVLRADGRMSLARGRNMQAMVFPSAKAISMPYYGDEWVAVMVNRNRTMCDVFAHGRQSSIAAIDDFVLGDPNPHGFPFIVTRDRDGLGVAELIRLNSEAWSVKERFMTWHFDRVLHLESIDGRPLVIGQRGENVRVGYHHPDCLAFDVEGSGVDRERLLLHQIGADRWRVFVPVKRGERWQVTDGELDYGPTLTKVSAITIDGDRIFILGFDGSEVKSYVVTVIP